MAFEFFEVIVGKDAEDGTAEAGAIHEGGVAKLVEDHDVSFTHQGRDGAQGGGVAGGETQGGFGALEGGEGVLEFFVQSVITADEAGGSARRFLIQSDGGGFPQARVGGEAEIVVRGKAEESAAVAKYFRALRRIQHPEERRRPAASISARRAARKASSELTRDSSGATFRPRRRRGR